MTDNEYNEDVYNFGYYIVLRGLGDHVLEDQNEYKLSILRKRKELIADMEKIYPHFPERFNTVMSFFR